MSDTLRCPQCGGELPADAPEGLCPECLLKARVETEAGPPSGPEPASAAPSPGRFVPPEPAELAPHFPQLEILELLGHGGMGAVYKARQPGLDRLVALKILPHEAGADPAFAERFTREARALAKLSHPNIVAVYDFGQTPAPRLSPIERGAGLEAPLAPLAGRGVGGEGPLYYFVMEYVDGVDLRQMLRAGQLQPREALAIVPQVCEALQFAHDEGIVHRDIKPENILVDKKGRVKIADFGLAKLLGSTSSTGVSPVEKPRTLTGTGQVMGTWNYMAPEQIEHPQAVDHRADIYSLGVVFYEMLTGELPIGRFAPPSKKVEVDVRLDEVVLKTLEKEPARRYQHAADVKTEVEQISRTSRPAAPSGAAVVEMPPSRRSLRASSRLLVKLAVWTAVVVAGWLFPILVSSHLFWLPWAGIERHERSLRPQSGAYPDVRLRAARTLYNLGIRLIAKGAWTATAKIDLPGPNDPAILEFDSHQEQWRWGRPPVVQTRSRIEGDISPRDVVEWMKDAGVDTSRPGVQEEAAELIRLLKDAASGIQPEGGYFAFLAPGPWVDTKIGPFTLVGPAASGFEGGSDLQGWHYLLVAALFLAVWYPGVRFIVRRHRRRLAAARKEEPARGHERAAQALRTPADQVRGPATGLLVAGALAVAAPLILVPALAIYFGVPVLYFGSVVIHRDEMRLFTVLELVKWWAVVTYPLGVLMILGAVSLRQLQSRWLAQTGAVVAVLPWSPAWLLGLPMGIWSLVVQNKRDVEKAFDAQAADSEALGQRIGRLGTGLFIMGILGALPGALALIPALVGVVLALAGTVRVLDVSWREALLILSLVPSIILLIAGRKTTARRSYGWAITGSMVAVLPLNIAWPVSLPIGIWALAVLTRPDAKAAFGVESPRPPSTPHGPGVSPVPTTGKEPDRRYQHASEVKTDVESIAAAGPPAAPPWALRPGLGAGPRPVPPGTVPQVLAVAIGMIISGLSVAAGVVLFGLAFLLDSPGTGSFWGWMGGAFGCIFGGLGGLAGSWNTYRQIEGAGDLMQSPDWTWLDKALAGYTVLGVITFVSGLVVSPWANWPTTYSLTLLGGMIVFQGGLFLVFRALARRAARQRGSGGNGS